MNRFGITFLLVAVLSCVSNSAFSDDIEAAKLALDNGDFVTSNKLFLNLAKSGNPEALEHLGWQSLVGSNGLEKNATLGAEYLKRALASYIKKASNGNPEAQIRLGNIYSKEFESKRFGTVSNKEESAKWYMKGIATYQKSAEKGNPKALTALAHAYRFAEGVEGNGNKAFELYKQAAEQKFIPAKEELGQWLSTYKDPKLEELGISYLEEASNEGSISSKKLLAIIYKRKGDDFSNGNGVTKDASQGFNYYLKAVNLYGEAPTQFNVGVAYYFGDGVYQDKEKAAYWLQKSASKGHLIAQYNLGLMLINGDGIPKNYLRGYVLMNIAAGRGKTEAANLRDQVEAMLSPQDRSEGQRKAAEWTYGVDL